MNFIFISPQFPKTYWNFCDRLKKRGVCVLGIGDTPYEALDATVRKALTEYYWLDSLADYDKVFRAVAFFSFKYGKIDWLESNNEHWLEMDARLRTDFHITTGIQADGIGAFKSKAEMKKGYAKANIPTARQILVTTEAKAHQFIEKVGWPVIVKPEVGVGAANTWKLEKDSDVTAFFARKRTAPYVMEEFVTGDIVSYDAIINSKGEPLFETMTVWPPSIMDIVLHGLDLAYYVAADMPEGLRRMGRAAVKAFAVKSRFVHLEFFRLTERKAGLGERGDFVGLEVNMRPAGGYTTDMMDFAHGTDVYEIWAEMVTEDRRLLPQREGAHCCVYAGRRDACEYVHSEAEILARYGEAMVMCERLPEMMRPQMGDKMYTVQVADEAAACDLIKFITERK